MKKYDGILKRVRQVEQKRGIVYARTDGTLYKILSTVYLLATIFALVMNLFYILGMLLINVGTDNMKNVSGAIITVTICSLGLIAGLLLKKFRLFIPSLVANIVFPALLLALFASLMEDLNGFLQLKTAYYWRHFAPLIIVVIMSIWITVIAIREKVKSNATYRKVEENLYNIYHTSANEVTEEQWQEFLDTYDGESPSKILKEEKEEKKEIE